MNAPPACPSRVRVPAALRMAAVLASLAAMAGCASVSSTSQFYMPVTADTYPPRANDAPVPIFGEPPDRPHKVIGRLAFSSDQGWKFMRDSMVFNARRNGGDAVILRWAGSKEEVNYTWVPPRTDWIPVPGPVIAVNQGGKKNNTTTYVSTPTYIPVFQPGYTRRWTRTIVAINSDVIVFKNRPVGPLPARPVPPAGTR